MWLFRQPSTAARTVLIYITAGALIVIWTAVWYVYLWNNPPHEHTVYYWVTGFMVTGLIMIFIGLVLGKLGKSDRAPDITTERAPLMTSSTSPLVLVNPAPAAVLQDHNGNQLTPTS